MDQHQPKQGIRSRKKKRSGLKTFLVVLILIHLIAGGVLFFWYQRDPQLSLDSLFNKKIVSDTAKVVEKAPVSTIVQEPKKADTSTVTINKTPEIQEIQPNPDKIGQKEDGNYSAKIARIEAFYSHLDEQSYIKAYKLPQPSKEYFTNLIVKLAQNPPVINRETDDLFTILKNTAHFFRILGKQNIQIIKGILDQEKDSFEDILASYYLLSSDPEYLKTNIGLDIPEKALYNYAGFFLNTMGGRLYLFRRDSLSRLLVSYYSILLIDRANREGTNSEGIDIRPAITSLINEFENTGNQIKLKETYLDELYALKEKYPQEPTQ